MGFWQTGYIEFHEPVGFEGSGYKPQPAQFPCSQCDAVLDSFDKLREHRFESHPLRRPLLIIRNHEVGRQRIRITRALTADEVQTEDCEQACLNGDEFPVSELPHMLARVSSDVYRLVLSGSDESAEFMIEFRIASEAHLKGIEEQFARMVHGRRLDTRAIDEFITATSEYDSAIGYCDGICTYLYGVLAKEKAADSTLRYEKYPDRFNKAGDCLAAYERPLARVIRSLIEFHFNHFRESALLAPGTRVGQAAATFCAWLHCENPEIFNNEVKDTASSKLEALLTDWETEQIVRWAVRPPNELLREAHDMASFLGRGLAEYDRVKLHVLLAEFHAAAGESSSVLEYAKPLRNLPALEKWAELRVREHTEE